MKFEPTAFHREVQLELARRDKLAELGELFAKLERDRPEAADFVLDYAEALAAGGGQRPRGQQ